MTKLYLTYDTEGDFLAWKDRPENAEGLWMPEGGRDADCIPVPTELAEALGAKEDGVLRVLTLENV